jgi:hypothetical protein
MNATVRFDCFANIRRGSRLLAGLLLLCGAAPGARADFLDDLFGGGETRVAPSIRARHVHARRSGHMSFSIHLGVASRERRHSAARKPAVEDAVRESGGESKPQKTVFCATGLSPRANPDSAEVRLHDGTLRAGDSVVTADGILVFKGHAACPHSAADFVRLAQSKLPRAKRNALESLEHSMQAGRAPLVLTGKETEPRVVSQISR